MHILGIETHNLKAKDACKLIFCLYSNVIVYGASNTFRNTD